VETETIDTTQRTAAQRQRSRSHAPSRPLTTCKPTRRRPRGWAATPFGARRCALGHAPHIRPNPRGLGHECLRWLAGPSTAPNPRSDLTPRGRGRRFWRAVTGTFEADPHDLELLAEVARMLDLVDRLRDMTADAPPAVDGRTNPCWSSCAWSVRIFVCCCSSSIGRTARPRPNGAPDVRRRRGGHDETPSHRPRRT
jgi:hypothetical protein